MSTLLFSIVSFVSVFLIFWGLVGCIWDKGSKSSGAALVIFGILCGYYSITSVGTTEIIPEQYRVLAVYVEQGKLSESNIDDAMSDGKISSREFSGLIEPLKEKNKEVEMSNAKQRLKQAINRYVKHE